MLGSGHLFTASFDEAGALSNIGWRCEGVPFFASNDGAEIHRCYHPANGDHLLTTSKDEVEAAKNVGYSYEGVAFRA